MASGLAAAVEKAGATFRYDAPVDRILRARAPRPGRWVSRSARSTTRRRRELIAADAVVCNADLPVAYRTLLGGVEAPRAARARHLLAACVLWVAGVRGQPPDEAAHHNIHFGAGVGRRLPGPHPRGPAACPTRRSS